MKFRQLTPFFIIMILIAVLLQVGCDTLVTESNTIIVVDTTLAIGCFDCHNDTDNLLLRPRGQFNNSAHANFERLDVLTNVNGINCNSCHTHEGFLKKFGGFSTIDTTAPNAINCYTCHLPHPSKYGEWKMDTLRASDISGTLGNGAGVTLSTEIFAPSNNCIHCHASTQDVDTTSASTSVLTENFGPHTSSQTDILSGKNGYFLKNTVINESGHTENGCITCHYGKTGDGQGYTFAEHTFRLEDKNTLNTFAKTCNNSTCHPTAGSTLITEFYNRPSIATIDSLSTVVKSLLATFELIDSTDTSGLTFAVGDTVPAIQAKAYYNYLLYKNDGSRGIHNPGFAKALLSVTAITLDSLPPLASFTSDDSIGCAGGGFPVTFTPFIKGEFDSIYWNYGDGTFDTTTSITPITKIYTNPGTFTVTLSVSSLWQHPDSSTQSSTIATVSAEDMILVDDVPVADFTTDVDTICQNEPVTFTSTSTHILSASMIWDFGDGDSSFIPADTHSYAAPGDYTVSLQVTTDCGVDDTVMTNRITVLAPPTAAFTFSNLTDSTYLFTDASIGAISWKWEFFTGTIDNLTLLNTSTGNQNPTYSYPNTAVERWVVLTVLNATDCMDADTVQIYAPPVN